MNDAERKNALLEKYTEILSKLLDGNGGLNSVKVVVAFGIWMMIRREEDVL